MFGLNKYVMIGLAVSAVANVGLGYLYKEALQDTARVQLQEQLDRAIAIQERTEVAALAQAAAAEAREAQLLSRLAQSNQVAEEAAGRADDSLAAAVEFEASLGNRRFANPDYTNWADTKLPDGVADDLRRLATLNSAPNTENE